VVTGYLVYAQRVGIKYEKPSTGVDTNSAKVDLYAVRLASVFGSRADIPVPPWLVG
jgi:hypothetical protein